MFIPRLLFPLPTMEREKCIFYESLAICLPIYLRIRHPMFLGKHAYKIKWVSCFNCKIWVFKFISYFCDYSKAKLPRRSTRIFRTNLFLMSLQKLILCIFLYVLIMYLQFDIYQSRASPCLPPFKIVFFICCLTIWSYQIHTRNWQNELLVRMGV